jgi:hypothetical protein
VLKSFEQMVAADEATLDDFRDAVQAFIQQHTRNGEITPDIQRLLAEHPSLNMAPPPLSRVMPPRPASPS